MAKHKFKEEKRFRHRAFYVLLGLIFLGASYRLVEQIVLAPVVSWGMVAAFTGMILVSALMIYLLSSVRFVTVVSKKGIKYQLYPLHFKRQKVKWDDIEEYKVVKLPRKDAWSGWNLYYSSDFNNYGFGEHKGLFVKLKNGENIFLGIEHEDELKKNIKKLARN